MSEALLIAYIQQLANHLEMEETPKRDQSGSYTFAFSENLKVTIKALTKGFTFFAPLGPPPRTNTEDFFRYLMRANLFGNGTGEGTIGLTEEGKLLTFTRISPYQMTYEEFKGQVEDFVNWVDLWQTKVQTTLPQDALR